MHKPFMMMIVRNESPEDPRPTRIRERTSSHNAVESELDDALLDQHACLVENHSKVKKGTVPEQKTLSAKPNGGKDRSLNAS